MQRELILSNISEAHEQLEAIEKRVLCPDYEEINFRLDLEHAYHHLNFAWNVRDESDDVLAIHAKNNFIKWSKYPKDDMEGCEF